MVEARKLKYKIKDTALTATMINCRKKTQTNSTKDKSKFTIFDGFKSSPDISL